jgi:hypothetical protein
MTTFAIGPSYFWTNLACWPNIPFSPSLYVATWNILPLLGWLAANGVLAAPLLLRRDRPKLRQTLVAWVMRNAEQGGADADKQQDRLCRPGPALSQLKKKRYSTGDIPGFYFALPSVLILQLCATVLDDRIEPI